MLAMHKVSRLAIPIGKPILALGLDYSWDRGLEPRPCRTSQNSAIPAVLGMHGGHAGAAPCTFKADIRGIFDGWMDGWMKDIWEPASYIALRLIVSLRILCNALYGHPFSEYCSYEKNIFF